MIIWGKVVGATIGLILYGPVGVILGLVFGHIFDNGLRSIMSAPQHPTAVRITFFKCVFQTMGYLAKLDGVVSENDIRVARDIMRHDFTLTDEQTILAMQYFNEGKGPQFDLQHAIQEFNAICGQYRDLKRFFLELQVKAVLADGNLHEAARGRLVYISSTLGISLTELEYLLRAYGYNFYEQRAYTQQSYQQSYYSHTNPSKVREDSLTVAYNLLGVQASDSVKTIKTAYRKLVTKYHPDKLVAKGLPPEMMRVAKEKTQQLNDAYALILRSRE